MSKSQIRLVGPYQLGEMIGKGAFGKVFKALNIETGQIIAIKQISITNITDNQSSLIQKEINLMKRLSHTNIVKYIGISYSDVITTDKYLNIVLEYIENGSLSGIVKKFNTIQERLVAFYIFQVLQGLKYLHSQGVVHRDIKGANLLTTKDGTVKLADFGVAMKLTESIKSMSIVGTPYWMAPEIVEQTGFCTTSCDIWSLGCTVIELLTGKPPYYDLEPMGALYRIVQDEFPPFPPNISSELKDFLMKCFQKEPFFRKSANELLDHPWFADIANKSITEFEDKILGNSKDEESSLILSILSLNQQNPEELKSVSIQSASQLRGSERDLRNLLVKSVNKESNDFSVDQSHEKPTSEDNPDDYLELSELLDSLDFEQTPKALHRLLALMSSSDALKERAACVLPILKQTLEDHEDFETLHLGLQLTNLMCSSSALQQLAGCTGLLSSALKFINEEYRKELRIEAAFLIGQILQSDDHSLHLLLASGGIEAVIKLLDPNFTDNKELVILGLDCLNSLLEDCPKEYMRVWATHGAVERLALALDNLSSDPTNQPYTEKVTDLLLTFSTGSLSILRKFCEEDVLSIIISTIHIINDSAKLQILTVLQNLATHRALQNKLENAGFIVDVVKLMKSEKTRDILLACVLILISLCKFSPARQEQAVLAGVVPILVKALDESTKIQQLSLSLLCSFVTASVACRAQLHNNEVLAEFIRLMPANPSILEAIASWVSLEPQKCRKALLVEANLNALVEVFTAPGYETVQSVVKMLRADSELALAVGSRQDFLQGLFVKLARCCNDAGQAKNFLDLLLLIAVKHPRPRNMMDDNNFYPLVVKILHSSRDEDLVVIEEIATLLLTIYSGKLRS